MSDQQAQGADQQQGQQSQQTPPWGDPENFNPEKAWKLIENLRDENKGLKARPVLDDDAQQKLAKYDEIVKANQTDLEKTQNELSRWQSEAETWRGNAVAATVKALAAADFADPDDAVRNIDPKKYLDAGGSIDEKAIRADLNALLDAKPHYRRAGDVAPRAPRPNAAQGASNGTPTDPASLFAGVMQQALNGS